MNKLLIDDYPILVLPKLAELIGLNEAIVLQKIHYWLNTSKHNYDGKKWIYNSYPKWVEQFPFWSERTVKRTFSSLKKQDLLFVGNYNKAGFDKTKWYSINYKILNELVARPSGQNDPTVRTNCHDGVGQNDPTNTIDYTQTTTQTTNNNTSATDVTREQFEEWWNLYDKKKDKKLSYPKFKKCLKEHTFEQIMSGTRKYVSSIKDKQYQKDPKTFLNNQSYMNEYVEGDAIAEDNPYANAFDNAKQVDMNNLPF